MSDQPHPTCKTCAHWTDEGGLSPRGYRICACPKICEPMDYDGADDSLVYEYDEGGEISTGPDFGCIHHEQKK